MLRDTTIFDGGSAVGTENKSYLYGAGGHAKVIVDILAEQGVGVEALVDDNADIATFGNLPVVHSARGLTPFIVSIGNNEARKRVAESLSGDFLTAIHPRAIVSPSASIGEGTVVMGGAVINADTRIGKHCIVNTGATVDQECLIGDYVHISPGVSLCGNVTVGEGTQVGVGTVVLPGIKIGRWSLVCAGSVVTKDIPDYCIASGNRCKVIKRKNMSDLTTVMGGGEIVSSFAYVVVLGRRVAA